MKSLTYPISPLHNTTNLLIIIDIIYLDLELDALQLGHPSCQLIVHITTLLRHRWRRTPIGYTFQFIILFFCFPSLIVAYPFE